MTLGNASRRSEGLTDVVFETASDLAAAGRSFLASEQGRQLRSRLAAVVIIGAPILSELPVFRRTIVGRLLRTAAVGTLIIKGAEWVRDWEPVASIIEQPPPG
jgi:hypothetical protein